VENNPALPATIGRTCHHPCEKRCNRGEYDAAVAINALEQYVGDVAIREGWALAPPAAERPQNVAVIGGGPAGLSCAYQLRRQGYQVAIIDANPELGGVLRYGVPEYRLPKGVLDAEVQRIVELGEVHTSRASARDLPARSSSTRPFYRLRRPRPKRLPQWPENDGRVLDGIAFLRSIRDGAPLPLSQRVVVIGGGSVAMDVAGSALRLGRHVRLLSLEGREVMPAPEEEIVDVLAEGAELCDAAMVKAVEASREALRLRCVKVDLDPAAPPGVLRPLEIGGSDFFLKAETVILAVGQDPALADWESCITVRQSMVVIDDDYMTSRRGLFAAGDVASAERFVSTAIGDGKRAAHAIARYPQERRAPRRRGASEAGR
jgi:NADPH-dependent glutamate synthase beta subunit-like oxidoreductase